MSLAPGTSAFPSIHFHKFHYDFTKPVESHTSFSWERDVTWHPREKRPLWVQCHNQVPSYSLAIYEGKGSHCWSLVRRPMTEVSLCVCSVGFVDPSWLLQGPAPSLNTHPFVSPRLSFKLNGDAGNLVDCPKSSRPGVEAYTCNLSIGNAEPGGPQWVWGQLGLPSEYQPQSYRVKPPYQKQHKTEEQKNQNENRKHEREPTVPHGLWLQVKEATCRFVE